jgi:Kef-type K+ transport system membrane component KefB
MENIWFQSALWMALALIAAIGSLFITISAALFEIVVGAIAGNTVGLPLTPWIDYIAGFGAIVLTFLAGTDIDPHVVKRNFASSVTIGLMGFFAPWLALAAGADRRHRIVHDIGRSRLCGDGRNWLQPNRTRQDHSCRLFH